jgi:hypothetical protein
VSATTTDAPLVVAETEGERTTPEPNPPAAVTLPLAPGVMTEETFAQLLARKGSSLEKFYQQDTPERCAATRARFARHYALQCSPMVEELREAMLLGDAFREQLLVILRRFAPLEAARVIETAGLVDLGEEDSSWGGDHFASSHRHCRKAFKAIRNFGEDIWETIHHFLHHSEQRAAE